MASQGRFEEAFDQARLALEIDPLSLPINTSLIWLLLLGRCYEESIKHGRRTLELEHDFVRAIGNLGIAYELKDCCDEAILQLQKSVDLSRRSLLHVSDLAHAYAAGGRQDDARSELASLQAPSNPEYVSPYLLALVHVGLGESREAVRLLGEAVEERSSWLVFLRVEPRFDPLRSDPRFQELVRKMDFPEK